jgi:hypothetical protein
MWNIMGIYIYIYTYIHMCVYRPGQLVVGVCGMYLGRYTYIYTYMYECIHAHMCEGRCVRMDVGGYVSLYVGMYARYVGMYVGRQVSM